MSEVILGPLYLFVTLFPALFPKQANNIMDGNPINYEPPQPFVPAQVVMSDDERGQSDEHVLQNMNRMVDGAKTESAKQLWTVKREEFLRQMRWSATMRRNQPSEAFYG